MLNDPLWFWYDCFTLSDKIQNLIWMQKPIMDRIGQPYTSTAKVSHSLHFLLTDSGVWGDVHLGCIVLLVNYVLQNLEQGVFLESRSTLFSSYRFCCARGCTATFWWMCLGDCALWKLELEGKFFLSEEAIFIFVFFYPSILSSHCLSDGTCLQFELQSYFSIHFFQFLLSADRAGFAVVLGSGWTWWRGSCS
jgi:hypothetical protein